MTESLEAESEEYESNQLSRASSDGSELETIPSIVPNDSLTILEESKFSKTLEYSDVAGSSGRSVESLTRRAGSRASIKASDPQLAAVTNEKFSTKISRSSDESGDGEDDQDQYEAPTPKEESEEKRIISWQDPQQAQQQQEAEQEDALAKSKELAHTKPQPFSGVPSTPVSLDQGPEVKKYLEAKGIESLFEHLLVQLMVNRPSNPLDYLIDLTRCINKKNSVQRKIEAEINAQNCYPWSANGSTCRATTISDIGSSLTTLDSCDASLPPVDG
ncbi:hypothetical protein RRG08_003122 [Elysia crispata]|uniref:Uncharacterized protein n=1 Tax=Elysia crispata TaxID=231223 RepID=A0AAE1EBB7_9GAST|nr:hypothetical protein RRG08_003122 [Elysia crispata]